MALPPGSQARYENWGPLRPLSLASLFQRSRAHIRATWHQQELLHRSPFHADIFRSFSWSVNICGRKKWFFFPPGQEDALRDRHGGLPYDVTSPSLLDSRLHPTRDGCGPPLEVTQEAGEMVFVPSGWHHQVHNLVGGRSTPTACGPMGQGAGRGAARGCPAARLAFSTFPNASCRVGRLSLWESLGMGWGRPWARVVLHVAMLVPAHNTADGPQPLCLRTCYFLE